MFICIHVSILIKNEDCYMITFGDMQNEKYFYSHCNGFEYNHDLVVIVFNKNMIF